MIAALISREAAFTFLCSLSGSMSSSQSSLMSSMFSALETYYYSALKSFVVNKVQSPVLTWKWPKPDLNSGMCQMIAARVRTASRETCMNFYFRLTVHCQYVFFRNVQINLPRQSLHNMAW